MTTTTSPVFTSDQLAALNDAIRVALADVGALPADVADADRVVDDATHAVAVRAAGDVVTIPADEHAALVADRLTVDHLAALLGTTPNWDGGADYLDSVASIMTVSNRPSVADGDQAWSYREQFQLATGRELPELHATEPECQGCFEQVTPGALDDDGWCADHPAADEEGEEGGVSGGEGTITADAAEPTAADADLHMAFERQILRDGR